MKYFIPFKDIDANGLVLKKDEPLPVISEYENMYYIMTKMGIKLGFDKPCENEMFKIVEE